MPMEQHLEKHLVHFVVDDVLLMNNFFMDG
jgi:hypothetical protein